MKHQKLIYWAIAGICLALFTIVVCADEPQQIPKLDYKQLAAAEPSAAGELLLADAGEAKPAAAPAKQSKSWWTDFSISPFGVVIHPNFGKPVWGAGIDVGYNLNHTVSLHVANLVYNPPGDCEGQGWLDGSAVDQSALLFRADLIRDSKERFVAYILASGDRDWNKEVFGFGAGIGAEVRLSKNFSVGADSRIQAWFKDEPKSLQTRGYLSARF